MIKDVQSVHLEFPYRHVRGQTSGALLSSTTSDWAVYHGFLRNVLPELLHDVDLQTGIHLRFMHDGAPPHFLLAIREFL